MECIDSKEYSWNFFKASGIVTDKSADLVYANLNPSAAAAVAALYDGQATTDNEIVGLDDAAKTNLEFKPPVPVYCDKGIYITVGSNVTGVLVIWRNR